MTALARIDVRTKDYGDAVYQHNKQKIGVVSEAVFNLHAAVGRSQPNHTGDVMVIQAMLEVVGEYNSFLAGSSPNELPDVSGVFDEKTAQAIWKFQKRWENHILSADGSVHPASFRGRKLRLGRRVMTISILNDFAREACGIFYSWTSHVVALPSRHPSLIAYLRF